VGSMCRLDACAAFAGLDASTSGEAPPRAELDAKLGLRLEIIEGR